MLCGQNRPTVSDTLASLNESSITAVKSGSPQNVAIINDLAGESFFFGSRSVASTVSHWLIVACNLDQRLASGALVAPIR